MERMGRDAVETIKITGRGMQHTGRRLRQWALVLFLSLAAIAFALPRLQTAAAIALALLAYNVLTTDWGRYAGPYAGIAARVVRAQMLFIEDSAGRPRAWLGVENKFDDERGARLVFYDAQGRARLAFRFSDNEFDFGGEGQGAEVVPGQAVGRMDIPPPSPLGAPPDEEANFRRRREFAVHAAAVHAEMESKHACDWATTHSGARRKNGDDEPEEGDRKRPILVMFDESGKVMWEAP